MNLKGSVIIIVSMAVAASLSACDGSTDLACTEIGCLDGLSVVVRGTPGVEIEIEASEPSGDVRNATCVVLQDGSCRIGFDGFVPEEVTVAVSGGGQHASVTVEPVYETLQPNGPDCPPICRQATVEVDLQLGAQHS